MAFQGWTDEAIAFFEDLEAENTKVFWEAHKPAYEDEVAAPMRALLADLAPEFGEGKVFRPYRDVRFSADKSPYKTSIAATLADGGYVQFSAAGLGAGVGSYHLAADQLERYRQAVDDDQTGVELVGIVGDLAASRCALIGHDMLKTAPRGYPRDHPRIDLLRRKSVAAWREFPPSDWLGSKRASKSLAGFFRSARPLRAWLEENVGDSEQEPR
jgi:uncharacterized protein (TIGR02453 family)